MSFRELINDPNVTIIDVRETWEFESGHVNDSINIPLGQVPGMVEEFRKMSKPLVLICASGNRSGQAVHFLHQMGLEDVHNGGGWMEVKFAKREAA